MSIPSGNTNSRKMKSTVIVEDLRLRDKLMFDLKKLGHEVEMIDPAVRHRESDRSPTADFCFVDSCFLEHRDRLSWADDHPSTTYISLWDFENDSQWEKQLHNVRGFMLNRSYVISELSLTLHHAAKMRELLSKHRSLDHVIERQLETEIVGISDAIRLLRIRVSEAIAQERPVVLFGEEGTSSREIARLMHVANLETTGSLIVYDCRCRPTNQLLDLLEEFLRDSKEGLSKREKNTIYIGHFEQISERQKTRILDVFGRLSSCVQLVLGVTTRESLQPGELTFADAVSESLAAIKIKLVPLRNRTEDIRLEARHCVVQTSIRAGVSIPRFSEDALIALENYNWPGNSHELYSVCEQICSLISDNRITREIVLPWLTNTPEEEAATVSFTLREMEKRLIEATFHRFGGNRERTAGALKIGIRTLCGKLREYGYPPRGGPGSKRIESRNAA